MPDPKPATVADVESLVDQLGEAVRRVKRMFTYGMLLVGFGTATLITDIIIRVK